MLQTNTTARFLETSKDIGNFRWNKISKFFKTRISENSEPVRTVDVTGEIERTVEPVIRQFSGWIHSLELPGKWIAEGVAPPNYSCKELAVRVAAQLYENLLLIPIRISVSIEEGVYLKYKNFDNDNVLEIEVYNDNLDIAAILTKNKEIIKSVDIDIEKDDLSAIVKLFNE